MGCDGSIEASSAQKMGRGPTQGRQLVEHVKIEYFPVLGRADPLVQMFEYHGQRYTKSDVNDEAWKKFKQTGHAGEFSCLPIITLTNKGREKELSQTLATLRCFGIKYGYYNPTNWKEARLIDPILDTWANILAAQAKIVYGVEKTEE